MQETEQSYHAKCGTQKRDYLSRTKIQRHVSRTFSVIDNDPSITDFGIMRGPDYPVAIIPMEDFARLAEPPQLDDDEGDYQDLHTQLVIVKAIFERSNRVWQFVWNGIRISAPIKDPMIFDKLERREYSFTQGDVLDATLRIYRVKDHTIGVFVNQRYEVTQVHGKETGLNQTFLCGPHRTTP